MTLIFEKNGKQDTRLIEYDQAVVRLGLEKASLESEVEGKRRELMVIERKIKQINFSYHLISSMFASRYEKLTEEEKAEIDKKSAVLSEYEDKVAVERETLSQILEDKNSERQKLQDLEKLVSDLETQKEKTEKDLVALSESRLVKEKAIGTVAEKLHEDVDNLNNLESQLRKVNATKLEAEASVEHAHRELKDLNEIIAVLQTTNRQGLDLVASFEGERQRLKEKEEFLIRKEKDLKKYEDRVDKKRKESGNDNLMVFT